MLSSSIESIESIQADTSPKSPNPFTQKYFQDFQDPNQFIISNELTNFLSETNSQQIPKVSLATYVSSTEVGSNSSSLQDLSESDDTSF